MQLEEKFVLVLTPASGFQAACVGVQSRFGVSV